MITSSPWTEIDATTVGNAAADERLAKDAARYRWLRDHVVYPSMIGTAPMYPRIAWFSKDAALLDNSLDSAIMAVP